MICNASFSTTFGIKNVAALSGALLLASSFAVPASAKPGVINPLLPPSVLNSEPNPREYNPLLPHDDLLNMRPKPTHTESPSEEKPTQAHTPDWATPGQTPGMFKPSTPAAPHGLF